MRKLALLLMLVAGCGVPGAVSSAEMGTDDVRQGVQDTVIELSRALLNQDPEALRKITDSQAVVGDSTNLALFRDAIRVQRDGWIRLFGNSAPSVEVVEVLGSSVGVRLGPDLKVLYFWQDAQSGRFLFSGAYPHQQAHAGVATQAVIENWSWRYSNYTYGTQNVSMAYAGDCYAGQVNHSVAANTSQRQSTQCAPAGIGSCIATSPNSLGINCRTCWYQWVGDDVWWNQNNTPLCHW